MKKVKMKSKAISYGFRSAYVVDGKYVIAAFGKGNKSEIVRVEDDKKNVFLEKDKPIDSQICAKKIKIIRNNGKSILETLVNKPNIDIDAGMDYLGRKNEIEKWIFGKEYSNNNLPIQIAYQILDIKKILAPFVNDIVYTINSLNRSGCENDIVGNLCFEKTWEEQEKNGYLDKIEEFKNFDKNARRYYGYFGEVFKKPQNEEKKDKTKKVIKDKLITEEEAEHYNYNVLRILSMVRQYVFHCKIDINDDGIESKSDFLYKLGEGMPKDLQAIVKDVYHKDIDKVNNQFLSSQGINLAILSELYKSKNEIQLAKELYDFVIKKENLNLGVRIASIREKILDNNMQYLKDNRYDQIRNKLYTLIDFVIYEYIITQDTLLEEIISKLRLCIGEEEKQEVYDKFANVVYKNIEDKLSRIAKLIDKYVKGKEKDIKVKLPQNIFIDSRNNLFVKLINYICKFLGKKEVNELLSQLINKFDGIASMLDILKEKGVESNIEFADKFAIFKDSAKIANDLKIVKSIARMKGEQYDNIYADAMDILGIERAFIKEEDFNAKSDKNNRNSTSIRNFVINNVLKSKAFLYIAKYTKPADCCEYAKNIDLLKYILKQIPEGQIERYYTLFDLKEKVDISQKIEVLASEIKKYFGDKNFKETIKCVKDNKQKPQAIVGLYLSVMFIFVKNMVKINSVYTMAYYAMERDMTLYGKNKDKAYKLYLLEEFLSKKKISPKNKVNIDKAITIYKDTVKTPNNKDYPYIARVARNKIDHLNLINNMAQYIIDAKVIGYYELYHYFLQRTIYDDNKDCEINSYRVYMNDVLRFKSYSKDLTKLIFLPIAYNQARYKNLVIDVLFNRYYGWNKDAIN